MKRFEFDRFFFKKISIMFSNLYRLSRFFRFSIAIIIWDILSHTISKKKIRYSKSISIKISKSKSDNFSILKHNQKKIKSEQKRFIRNHECCVHFLMKSKEKWMIQIFFEIFFNFVHNVFAFSTSLIVFDIRRSRQFVFYESIANSNKFFSLFFFVFVCQRDSKLKQFAIVRFLKNSLIVSIFF